MNTNTSQARTQGGGGFGRTPLLSCTIHMNLYGTYVSHTHLDPYLVKKNPPLLGAAYRPASETILRAMGLQRDGWHTAAIATAGNFYLTFLLPTVWGVAHSSALALCTPARI